MCTKGWVRGQQAASAIGDWVLWNSLCRQDGEGVPANSNVLLPSTAFRRLHGDFKMSILKHGSVSISIRLQLYKHGKKGGREAGRDVTGI